MALERGSRLGSYTIEEELGSGGMGEVYRARDERLNRTVAIKLLLPAQAGDAERRARFLQEARSASALNHPNIITIYDIGYEGEGGRDYLVMEYLSGKTLDELIPTGGLRESRAVSYAVQIASAMSAAHGAGIVHRDLKPANVMVTEGGMIKVLDFGLAKSMVPVVVGDGSQEQTTDTTMVPVRAGYTGDGRIAGTAAYMSPEQAEGGKVDARSDIFAFGCVFYEMLTGISPFKRDSVISSLSAVLRDEPKPLHEIYKNVSGDAEKIVQRCLRKEPDRRFQSSADLKVVLQELKEEGDSKGQVGGAGTGPGKLPPASEKRNLWPWIGVAVGLLAVGAAIAGYLLRGGIEPAGSLPPTASLLSSLPGYVVDPALSPDGNQVAFAWDGGIGGLTQIYVKVVGAGDPIQVTNGSEFATEPAWSPDGTSIGFQSSNSSRVGVAGGSPGVAGVAGLAAAPRTRILVVSALGGTARELTSYEFYSSGFSWSTDGRSMFVSTGKAIYLVSMESREKKMILQAPTNHIYREVVRSPDGNTLAVLDSTGHLEQQILLLKVGEDGRAQGAPRLLPVSQAIVNSAAWTSDSRMLIFGGSMSLNASSLWRVPVNGDRESRLGNLGENGESPSIVGPSGRHGGRMVFMHVISDVDIWKIPLANGQPGTPVPLIASTQREWDPRYSPDGKRIAFTSDRGGLTDIWVANADGFGTTQLTTLKGNGTGGARWSPDGKQIAFLSKMAGQSEIYTIDAQGGAPVRITNNPAHDTAPMWSPDGRWLYFASDRGGTFEIWRASPKENGEAVQVTHHGGYSVIFAPDGKAMYYCKDNPAGGIWKQVLVDGEPSGEETHILPVPLSNWGNFDVTKDGIVYVPMEQGTAHIYFYRFADGITTKVGTFTGAEDFGISISPVDGSVLYSQVNKPRRELMLVENFR